MNTFMKATKNKLRFTTTKGTLTTECLWDLHIEELDKLVIELKEATKKAASQGYLTAVKDKESDSLIKLQFDVAEEIILTRVAEMKAHEQAANNKLQRDKLLAIIATKESKAMEDKDIETLKEMAESLK